MTVVNGVRVFSNSEVQAFKWCRRHWWLAWHRGLTPKIESVTSAAATGTRVHEALASWYVPDGDERVDPLFTLTAVQDRDMAIHSVSALRDTGDDEAAQLLQTESELRSTFELERRMVEGYLEWVAESGVDSELEVLGAERYVEAAVEVEGVGLVKLIAKLDALVRHRVTGLLMFIDHKTVGSFSIPELGMSQQMLHYHLIQRLTAPSDRRPAGALYNMLRKVKRTRASKPPYYERRAVPHNDHELEAYSAKLVGVIGDVVEVERRLEAGVSHQVAAYSTPSRDCAWRCQFFKVCRMLDDGSRAEAALEDLYEVRSPLDYYGGREKVEE